MIRKMKLRGRGYGGGGSATTGARLSVALVTLGLSCATGAQAQSLETQAATGTAAPTESTVINLINLLVKRGVLTQQNANDLIREARAETAQAKATSGRAVAGVGAAGAAGMAVVNAPTQPGDVAVPYVPQVVRDQIRDQVKQEVVAQAKAENWAQPNTFPDWVSRIKLDGDLRVRDEFHFYGSRNANNVTNFAAINQGGGFDINGNTNTAQLPTQNTTQNRNNLERYRARLGVTALLSDEFSAGIQLASGNDNGPVSTTATAGGGFAKKNIWLNKAFFRYQPNSWLNVVAGRFDNPFFTSDLLFSNDLEMDGLAASFRHALPINPDVTLFGTFGVFPIQYTSENFPSNSTSKVGSDTKWMFGAQLGAEWKIDQQNRLKGALAYYDYQNMRGTLSSPCALYLGATNCSTDNEAPAFLQGGNTLVALRNIVQNPNLAPGMTPEPQLFGLAYNYRLLDIKAQWDTVLADRVKVRLDGEFVRNLAYNTNKAFGAATLPVNNYEATTVNASQSDYRSGPNGYLAKVTFGEPDPSSKGQWNFSVAYKYLQPDATLDAFNDPDFHLGGTNARGYILGAAYAVARDTWLSARYLSAKEVYGPPVSIDVLQIELNARF
ncbi:putative porin [Paraburkholderia bryophila]|uniref:Putative porin n=1 Tax=Paraburkholderia bryophila TaxID=420952 RepID=A0A329CX38_9BURK|nr:putative porin [Paraburkholderia bryophila]